MHIDAPIRYLNRLLAIERNRELSELELLVIEGIWHDRSYQELGRESKYEVSTIRNAASRLFREIEQATGEEISKKSLKGTILKLVNIDATSIDLADAPTDIQPFCGRDDEIKILTEWIEIDRCKLVALMGIGGIGKTAIAAKIGDNLAANFDFTIWKSLREAPPLSQLIIELVQFLSRFTEIELPAQIDRQIGILMDYLRQHRCLLILDNLESMMEVGELAGNYRTTHRDYGELFKRLGTTPHQSCVLLTSREMPPEIIELAAPTLPVRAMFLDGLDRAAYDLLTKMGLTNDDDSLATIVANCQGNPLYLRIIANTIFYNFQGQIDRFLSADRYNYSKITNILHDQFDRLSIAEKIIIYHLAVHREPMTIDLLKIQLQPIAAIELELVETLVSLGKRSLIQMTRDGGYTLQNVVMEFATVEIIEELAREISGSQVPFFFNNIAIYPASAPKYIRDVLVRLLLSPLLEKIGQTGIIEFGESYLALIDRGDPVYGVGNIIELLIHSNIDLKNFDWRDRVIREVDFQGVELKEVDFSGSRFDRCRFAAGMDTVLGISFSPDGKYLAASDTAFKIKIWSAIDGSEIATLCGHQGWVWEISFSPDSKYLASGSSDRTVRIWEINSGRCLQTIEAHDDWVWKINFIFNSKTIVTIGADRQIKLWRWESSLSLIALKVPDLGGRDAAFSGQKGVMAVCFRSGIDLWHLWTARKLYSLTTAEAIGIKKVSFSEDGSMLVGISSKDCCVYGWDVDTGKLILTLSGHPTQVNEIQTNDSGEIITTCLEQVRVWNRYTGDCLRVVNFAKNSTICVAYHPDRSRGLLATGSDNGVIKIWNLTTGQCTNTNQGNAPRTIALATSHHHQIVVSGKDDGILHFWDLSKLQANIRPPAIVCHAHTGTIFNLAYSPSGELVASAGSDRLIKVWEVETGRNLHTFSGHTDYIAQIEFVDDRYLITRCYNSPLREWDLVTGESKLLPCVKDGWIQGFSITPDGEHVAIGCNAIGLTMWHRSSQQEVSYPIAGSRLRRFAHSIDGRWLVAVTDDSILNLWDLQQDYHHQSWRVSMRETRSICPHPRNPELLIIGGDDGELAIWHLQTKICIARNGIHQLPILSVNTLLDPDRIVSCGVDGSIRLWELKDRRLIQTYAIEFSKPYQNANFTAVKGLNKSQLTTLAGMGAKVRSI